MLVTLILLVVLIILPVSVNVISQKAVKSIREYKAGDWSMNMVPATSNIFSWKKYLSVKTISFVIGIFVLVLSIVIMVT